MRKQTLKLPEQDWLERDDEFDSFDSKLRRSRVQKTRSLRSHNVIMGEQSMLGRRLDREDRFDSLDNNLKEAMCENTQSNHSVFM